MSAMQRMAALFAIVVLAVAGCSPAPATGKRVFSTESFSFTIPAGWQTSEEVWGRPIEAGQEVHGLGVQEMVTIQYPPGQGEGSMFFSVGASPVVEGQDLETRMAGAYQVSVPIMEEVSQQPFELGALAGFEITYKAPSGEPWWHYRDLWLEKDGMVYLLSFHTYPDSFDSNAGIFQQILDSFQFKD